MVPTGVFRSLSPRSSFLFACLSVLSGREKVKYFAGIILQIVFNFLDLIGVILIGLTAAVAVNPKAVFDEGQFSSILPSYNFVDVSNSNLVVFFATSAVVILLIRTAASIFVTRKLGRFLSNKGSMVTSLLLRNLFEKDLITIRKRTTHEIIFATTEGVRALTLEVLASLVLIISDTFLLVILLVSLAVIDFKLAAMTIIFFSLIIAILYSLTYVKAVTLGSNFTILTIQSQKLIDETLSSYRELIVQNRVSHYLKKIDMNRKSLSKILSEQHFMPNLSKYVIEISLVLILFVVILYSSTFSTNSTNLAGTIGFFVGASTRIGPAILRIQQAIIVFRGNIPRARLTLELFSELVPNDTEDIEIGQDGELLDFDLPIVEFVDVSMRYGGASSGVQNLNFKILAGEKVAIVGASGAGKSTVVDLILGIIEPEAGEVRLCGRTPRFARNQEQPWISYVPQSVSTIQGTIKENILLGYDSSVFPQSEIARVLEISQLDLWVGGLEAGIESTVGENASTVSGGQKQRIGIARSMLIKPRLLILDEATSSLDAQSEKEVSKKILEYMENETVIVIAHKLSVVRDFSKIIYLENGKLRAQGSFSDLLGAIPEFKDQANHSGVFN